MNPIEQEACESFTGLMLKLHKDEQKNGKSMQGFFLHLILQRLLVLGSTISTDVPKEKADQTWQEFQDIVSTTRVGYNCNSPGWTKLLYSIIFLYLESPNTFDMFNTKIREATVSVLGIKIKHTEKKEENNND